MQSDGTSPNRYDLHPEPGLFYEINPLFARLRKQRPRPSVPGATAAPFVWDKVRPEVGTLPTEARHVQTFHRQTVPWDLKGFSSLIPDPKTLNSHLPLRPPHPLASGTTRALVDVRPPGAREAAVGPFVQEVGGPPAPSPAC